MSPRSNTPMVVAVTGASAGLGRAIAVAFARRGDAVALLARDEDRLKEAAAEVEDAGGRALVVPADVASFEELTEAAARIERELGGLDVWVNNAMASIFAPFLEIDMDDFHRATEVDYLGFVHGTRAALDRMVPRGRGVIVQVSSALGHRSIPLQSPYCGAKHAIIGFTESLRTELLHAKSPVHVTMVHMPALNTPQFDWVRSTLPRRARPVAPVYAPEVGARAVVWSATHPARREVYVGGSTMATVLAQRLAPGVLDRYLARAGFSAQQTNEPESAGRPDDLDAPVHRHVGEHGRFGDESHPRSAQLALTLHRRVVAALTLLGVVLAVLAGPARTTVLAAARRRMAPTPPARSEALGRCASALVASWRGASSRGASSRGASWRSKVLRRPLPRAGNPLERALATLRQRTR